MAITGRALPRRTILRGLGAAVALPFLDAMTPAFASARTRFAAPRRLGIVYVPNGMRMRHWTPDEAGPDYALSPILAPLAGVRDRLTIVSGLSTDMLPQNGAAHASASTRFLTNANPGSSDGAVSAAISMDQLAAGTLGRSSTLRSLEVGLDDTVLAGSCDRGYSCAYQNTISWSKPTSPVRMEHSPRLVFERLFGDADLTPDQRRAERQGDRSLLDSILGSAASLQRELGGADRGRLDEYLESIRDVERRLAKMEEAPSVEAPAARAFRGEPADFATRAKMMFDLMTLAYQTDTTRVCSMMVGPEASHRSYPEIGVSASHHEASHHHNDPEKLESLTRINTYHASLFAYWLEKLSAAQEGDGTLLDQFVGLYGSGMSDGNVHVYTGLPVAVVGRPVEGWPAGQHVEYERDVPMGRLHATILRGLGAPESTFGEPLW